jgi:Tol biopolymer transport system component
MGATRFAVGRRAARLAVCITASVVCAIAALTSVTPAHATFPGRNGKIFFTSNRADPGFNQNPTPGLDTYRMNPDGSAVQRLTGTTWPFDSRDERGPAVSPDGKLVAVTVVESDSHGIYSIYVMKRDGSSRLWYGWGRDPAWSPSGGQIAFTSITREAGGQLTVMDADGSHRHLVHYESAQHGAPDWSPDGTRIAFTREPLGSGLPQIATIRPDGTGLQVLTSLSGDEEANDPSWSPDGNVIAFTVDGGSDAPGQVALVNSDGSASVRVTSGAKDGNPSWSPNGRRIAFSSDRDEGIQIFTMNPSGSDIRRVTHPPLEDPESVWNLDPFWDSLHTSG